MAIEIDTNKIIELQKILESYSSDFTMDNDTRLTFWKANKIISELVGELTKYKSKKNSTNFESAIKHTDVSVWSEVPVDQFSVVNERENVFDNINNAIRFINGEEVENYCGEKIQKKPEERIGVVEMRTDFDVEKLVNLKEKYSRKEFASSYIGEVLYRIDIDPAMTNDGEDYEIKTFAIDAVEKYWDGNLVLMSGKEEVCLFDNIDTEKPFLDYYITFSSKEKAREYVEKRMEKGEERDDR